MHSDKYKAHVALAAEVRSTRWFSVRVGWQRTPPDETENRIEK